MTTKFDPPVAYDVKLFPNIPNVRTSAMRGIRWTTEHRRESPVPSADRRGPHLSWYCIAEQTVEGFDSPRQEQFGIPQPGRRFTFAAYCGAPPGVRCSCGAQLDGHDPGDEDARP